MDPRERLRMALLGAGCTRCGRPYPVAGIQVLAQREEIAFVQLVCYACHTQTLALVTGSPDADADADAEAGAARDRRGQAVVRGPAAEPGRDGSTREPWAASLEATVRRDGTPISEADVRDMHLFLDRYEGDLRALVERRGRGAGGR